MKLSKNAFLPKRSKCQWVMKHFLYLEYTILFKTGSLNKAIREFLPEITLHPSLLNFI